MIYYCQYTTADTLYYCQYTNGNILYYCPYTTADLHYITVSILQLIYHITVSTLQLAHTRTLAALVGNAIQDGATMVAERAARVEGVNLPFMRIGALNVHNWKGLLV